MYIPKDRQRQVSYELGFEPVPSMVDLSIYPLGCSSSKFSKLLREIRQIKKRIFHPGNWNSALLEDYNSNKATVCMRDWQLPL